MTSSFASWNVCMGKLLTFDYDKVSAFKNTNKWIASKVIMEHFS